MRIVAWTPTCSKMAEDTQEHLIELVRNYPFLYDKTSKAVALRDARNNPWLEITRYLGQDVTENNRLPELISASLL